LKGSFIEIALSITSVSYPPKELSAYLDIGQAYFFVAAQAWRPCNVSGGSVFEEPRRRRLVGSVA
jgi:hypothetical protein